MGTVKIVMVDEHGKDALKMRAVRDQQPVQTLGSNSPDEAFRDRVRCRRSSRRPIHLNTSLRKTASKSFVNFWSRSRMRNQAERPLMGLRCVTTPDRM